MHSSLKTKFRKVYEAVRSVARAIQLYPTQSPLTFGYVCLLLLTHTWIGHWGSGERTATLLRYVSTNLANLTDHPISSLLGSALFFQGTLTHVTTLEFQGTFLTLGLGVAYFLARAEHRWGRRRAFTVFLVGHVGATLLTAVIIGVALRHGWYNNSVRVALDYGISYGAQTMMAASVTALPRYTRLPWAVFLLAWPLVAIDWSQPVLDFTTIGHIIAAVIGFAFLPPRPQSRFSNLDPARSR
ncbi:rhomboid-like protein [Streptomyces sp. NPDC059193]|uniref:rhomboid-like protein n=1 Tax=Streptomyces sp. NPDC059193 TaxID=3346763 RepID=UPI0036BCAD5E